MNFFPRQVQSIHQIEITSECNLRCRYCPHPKMKREKMHMTMSTFGYSLQWVQHFIDQGTQVELNLTGIGEPTLHPDLVEMVRMAREVMGDRFLSFSTNGILVTRELCERLKPYEPRVYVSNHRPEKSGLAAALLREYGMLHDTNSHFVDSGFDWAGQVEWPVSAARQTCMWLFNGWSAVLADGRVTTCCFDAEGKGVIGDVRGTISAAAPRFVVPFALCDACHLVPPEVSADGKIYVHLSRSAGETFEEQRRAVNG